MAVFMGNSWNQKHHREVLRLMQDIPGLAQKALVLWFCLVLGVRKLSQRLHRKIQPVFAR